eukprot:4084413-Amphidinium_carterae.1
MILANCVSSNSCEFKYCSSCCPSTGAARQSHAHRLLSSKLDLYPVWDEKPAQTPQGACRMSVPMKNHSCLSPTLARKRGQSDSQKAFCRVGESLCVCARPNQ